MGIGRSQCHAPVNQVCTLAVMVVYETKQASRRIHFRMLRPEGRPDRLMDSALQSPSSNGDV